MTPDTARRVRRSGGIRRYGGKGMDESIVLRNDLELRGALAAAPQFSHMSRGERFFVFPVETRRLSARRTA